MQPNGKKEIRDAVSIALLITFGNAMIAWGMESMKAKVAEIKAKKRKAEDEKKEK